MPAATGPARIPARTRLVLILPPIPLRYATRRAAAKDSRAARCRPPNGSPARKVFTSSQKSYLLEQRRDRKGAFWRDFVGQALSPANRLLEVGHVYRMWHR